MLSTSLSVSLYNEIQQNIHVFEGKYTKLPKKGNQLANFTFIKCRPLIIKNSNIIIIKTHISHWVYKCKDQWRAARHFVELNVNMWTHIRGGAERLLFLFIKCVFFFYQSSISHLKIFWLPLKSYRWNHEYFHYIYTCTYMHVCMHTQRHRMISED